MPKTILNGCCPEITWRVGPFPHGALQCAPTWPTQECGDVLQIPRGAAFLYQSSPVTTPDPCNFTTGRLNTESFFHAFRTQL